MNRRKFIQTAGALAVATAAAPLPALHAAEKSTVTARHLPRWRGFNLLQKFVKKERGNPPFPESDFALVSEWGFDFTRLPLSYLCWTDPNDWLKLREEELKHLDDAVAYGGKHGVHVNLNLHRAPGYCVNPPKEPLELWPERKRGEGDWRPRDAAAASGAKHGVLFNLNLPGPPGYGVTPPKEPLELW